MTTTNSLKTVHVEIARRRSGDYTSMHHPTFWIDVAAQVTTGITTNQKLISVWNFCYVLLLTTLFLWIDTIGPVNSINNGSHGTATASSPTSPQWPSQSVLRTTTAQLFLLLVELDNGCNPQKHLLRRSTRQSKLIFTMNYADVQVKEDPLDLQEKEPDQMHNDIGHPAKESYWADTRVEASAKGKITAKMSILRKETFSRII